jgi:hypothetical protein
MAAFPFSEDAGAQGFRLQFTRQPGTQELVSQALKLDPAERFDVVDQILRGLNRPDPEVDRIWLEEAERRLRAYREGRVKGISAEEIFGSL